MTSEPILRHDQPRLPLDPATLWDKLPEPTRARVRQLLMQMLQQASSRPAAERSCHERED